VSGCLREERRAGSAGPWREREREGEALGWGKGGSGRGPRGGREERGERAGPRVAHAGERGKGGWAGPRLLGWAAYFCSFSFPSFVFLTH
jgi:hypothetical protein